MYLNKSFSEIGNVSSLCEWIKIKQLSIFICLNSNDSILANVVFKNCLKKVCPSSFSFIFFANIAVAVSRNNFPGFLVLQLPI